MFSSVVYNITKQNSIRCFSDHLNSFELLNGYFHIGENKISLKFAENYHGLQFNQFRSIFYFIKLRE